MTRIVLCLLFLRATFVVCAGFQMQPIGVTPDNTTINMVTRYTFAITRSSDQLGYTTPWDSQLVPAGSNFTITFPTGYNTAYGYTSQVNGTTYPVTQTGQNITIQGLFPVDTAVDTMTVVINNVLNPSPAFSTDEFLCFLGNDFTNISDGSYASVTLTAGAFKACTVGFSPGTVNKTNSFMQVGVTIQNGIPAGSSIIITMPSLGYWYYDIAKQAFPVAASMACSNTSSVLTS